MNLILPVRGQPECIRDTLVNENARCTSVEKDTVIRMVASDALLCMIPPSRN
ncbi:hypothetical protein H9658_18730 [Xanthomonas sp. Sa3BUA13]|nr:hypothetical protein [Xanthomonas surreyensis]